MSMLRMLAGVQSSPWGSRPSRAEPASELALGLPRARAGAPSRRRLPWLSVSRCCAARDAEHDRIAAELEVAEALVLPVRDVVGAPAAVRAALVLAQRELASCTPTLDLTAGRPQIGRAS